MKVLPAHMRQYQAFDYVQKMVKGYLKVCVLYLSSTISIFFFFFFFFAIHSHRNYSEKHFHGFLSPDSQWLLKKTVDAIRTN